MSNLKVDVLADADVQQFIGFYNEMFGRSPALDMFTKWVVLKDEDRIVGCLGLYRPIVVDSMAIRPEYRCKGNWRKLVTAIKTLFSWPSCTGLYFFAFKPSQEAAARKFGMTRLSNKLYRKVF